MPRKRSSSSKPSKRKGPHATGAKEAPRISLCMIARNEEANISAALSSIEPWVDQMIVVDTGSTDRTKEIARSLGAEVYDFEWCDDFSAARNESLEHAKHEWIFWMDADDTINEESGSLIRAAARDAEADVYGFVIEVKFPPGSDGQGVTVVDHIKLIRNLPELRFEHRIHEQILPSIRRARARVRSAPIVVMHTGHDFSPEGQHRKRERDLRILRLELQERPDHPFVLFNMGMTLTHLHQHPAAIPYLEESISRSDPEDSIVRKGYALLASAHESLGRLELARQVVEAGLERYPKDPELLFRAAMILQKTGDPIRAEALYLAATSTQEADYLKSVDPGVRSYLAFHNVGMLRVMSGRVRDAEEAFRTAVEAGPHFAPAWRALGDILLSQGRVSEAGEVCERALEVCPQDLELLKLGARIAMDAGAFEKARECLSVVEHLSPMDLGARTLRTYLLLKSEQYEEAEDALIDLTRLDPSNIEAFCNLGTLYLQQRNPTEALRQFKSALNVDPSNSAAQRGLAASETILRQAIAVSAQAVRPKGADQEMPPIVPQAHPKGLGLTSIVIPCWNNAEFTARCLASITDTTKPKEYELILIDNGSQDGTRDLFVKVLLNENRARDIKIIHNARNLGVTKAWNQGINAASGYFVAILNNDIEVAPGWLSPLLLSLSDQIWATCPYHTRFNRPDDWPSGKTRHPNESLLGCCFVCRTELFRDPEVGLFDEEMQLWFNDTDLVEKMRSLGRDYMQVSDSYVHHYYSQSISRVPDLNEVISQDKTVFDRKRAERAKRS